MAKRSRGNCAFCNKQMTRSGMEKHFEGCPERLKAIDAVNAKRGVHEYLYTLSVRDQWAADYWLFLEMTGSARLSDLDDYLRYIWLDCCGHMSQFSFGGWQGEELNMKKRIDKTIDLGEELTHIYDFGTSSETLIKVVNKRRGRPLTKHPIKLMARNEPAGVECMECGKPAEWHCLECVTEYEKSGALCESCVEDHPHEDYGDPVPLVNSPRLGMCGYDGPSEPPY